MTCACTGTIGTSEVGRAPEIETVAIADGLGTYFRWGRYNQIGYSRSTHLSLFLIFDVEPTWYEIPCCY